MTTMSFEKKYPSFTDRVGRAKFIAETFETELAESKNVLDVGSDYNSLKKLLGSKVTGVDLYGEPDIVVDFEKELLSRFQDNQFEMVVCTEVLEHLDNFHAMAEELHRVSSRYILISLPNCLSIFTKWNILFKDKASKYYGLPLTRPEDRHRWFFSYKDVDAFFRHFCRRHRCKIRRQFLQVGLSNSWRGRLFRSFVQAFNIDNAAQSLWLLIEKPTATKNKRRR